MENTQNYLDLIESIEELPTSENCIRRDYYVKTRNTDKFIIEISTTIHNKKRKNDLAVLWKKAGYVSKFLPTTITVRTYYTDTNGECREKYNIQLAKDFKINFDYMLEATESNINYLVGKCIDLYMNDHI